MKKEYQEVITKYLGVEPILINSSLVSAQNRERLYWTNIENIEQPKDKGIFLKDILEKDKDIDFIDNFKNCVRKNLLDIDVNNYLKSNGFSQIPSNSGFQDHKIGIIKTPCLRAGNSFTLIQTRKKGIRLATPLEWERLQTVPDFFTSKGLDIHSQTLYNGNECNTKEVKCQKPVESKNVISLSQVGKLNSAINTILGSLDMEQLKPLENLSIKAKSVLSMGVKENSKQLKVCASSIINLGKENSLLMEAKNVRYAISQSEVGQMECVLSIISNNKETETLCRTKLENMSLSEMGENTIKTKMVDGLIGELQKKLLEENSEKEKLYIILTLINSIIALAILKSSQTQSISLCIDSLNLLRGNLLEMDLLSLKMENIVDVSNSSRYKAIGNGWTVDVIAHIFKGIGE